MRAPTPDHSDREGAAPRHLESFRLSAKGRASLCPGGYDIDAEPLACANVRKGDGAFGFNAEAGQYQDLIEAGVIDPAKVARLALQNAASVASLMLTTEAVVAEK